MKNFVKEYFKEYVEAQKRLNSKQNWIDSLYCTAINMAIYTVAMCTVAGVNMIVKKVSEKKSKTVMPQYEYYSEMEEIESEEDTEE